MNKIVSALDNIPERILLIINTAFALFVGVAHGGALAVSNLAPDDNYLFIKNIATVSLPLIAVVLVTSLWGFIVIKNRILVLKIHSIILILTSIYSIYWVLSLIFFGFPKGNFAWSPGFLTVIITYSVFLFRRSWLTHLIQSTKRIRYIHIITFFIVLPIDIAVFIKFISRLISREQFL